MKVFIKSPWGAFTIITLLAIIALILYQLNNYKSVTPGVWLQTSGTLIGAFLGAALAGYISQRNVSKQIKFEKNRQTKTEVRNMENAGSSIISNIYQIERIYKDILDHIRTKELTLKQFERYSRILNYSNNALKKSDSSLFSNKTYVLIQEIQLTNDYTLIEFDFNQEEIKDVLESNGVDLGRHIIDRNSVPIKEAEDRIVDTMKTINKILIEKKLHDEISIEIKNHNKDLN